jgi:hypothetical protein
VKHHLLAHRQRGGLVVDAKGEKLHDPARPGKKRENINTLAAATTIYRATVSQPPRCLR